MPLNTTDEAFADQWQEYTVETKATWDASFLENPYLICERLVRAVSPTIESANLKWRQGIIIQPEKEMNDANFTAQWSEYDQLDLRGNFVRITLKDVVNYADGAGLSAVRGYPSDQSDMFDMSWAGYVVGEKDDRHGEGLATTADSRKLKYQDQIFVAYGLSWFLERKQVTTTIVRKSGSAFQVNRAMGFNTGEGAGRTTEYAKRGNKDSRTVTGSDGGSYDVFTQDDLYAELWNGYEIVRHLLEYHQPVDTEGNFSPVPFKLDASAEQYLDWFEPSIYTEGRTVFDVLNDVISPSRGLVWWLDYSPTPGSGVVTIFVSSANPTNLEIPGGQTLPASYLFGAVNFDSEIRIPSATVNFDNSRLYDQILVRGAFRTTTLSLSAADNNLTQAWTPAQQTEYNDAEGSNPIKNRAFREQAKYAKVYQTFVIPDAWDGKSADGTGQGTPQEFACPELYQGGESPTGDSAPFNPAGLRTLRTTPLAYGLDYTVATDPTGDVDTSYENEKRPPFALGWHEDGYVYLDRAAGHRSPTSKKVLRTSYRLYNLESAPGVSIKPNDGANHRHALNHFDPKTAGRGELVPELDWTDTIVTMTVEWDSYAEGIYPTTLSDIAPIQQLVIYAGDRYRLDYLAKNTVFDIDKDGVVKKCTSAGPLQDDRDTLVQLAQLAYNWYRLPRATLEISFIGKVPIVPLGSLITHIGDQRTSSESKLEVNSVASQIVFYPEEGRTDFYSNYAEIDFGRFL